LLIPPLPQKMHLPGGFAIFVNRLLPVNVSEAPA
jgi:hypothetical protein